MTLAGAATLVPAYRFALRALDLPLRELIANVERPAMCSLPVAVGLLGVRASTGSLPAGIQLLALVLCGLAVYSVSAFVLARSELQAITAAFRSS